MTPSQYEQRCREMLQRNAHNMTAGEVEACAYGARDAALCELAHRADKRPDSNAAKAFRKFQGRLI